MPKITTTENKPGTGPNIRKAFQLGRAYTGSTFLSPEASKGPLHCSEELKVQTGLTGIRQQLL